MSAALALLLSLVAQTAEVPQGLGITSPPQAHPLFGRQQLTLLVERGYEVRSVEFFVDGTRVGSRAEAPWSLWHDFGDVNREHSIEFLAHLDEGDLIARMTSPAFRIDSEITSELRQFYATVHRGVSRLLDLERDEIILLDEGVPHELVTFGRGNVRLQAAILVDSSISMRGGRLGFAVSGARAFVAGLKPEDEASVVLFSDRLLRATPFQNDPQRVLDELGGVQAQGGTALHDHVYMALHQLEERLGRRVLIILSDGIDSHSGLEMEDVLWLARRSRSMVYWIRTGASTLDSLYSSWKGPADYERERELLETCVEETGGRVIELESVEEAEAALADVLQELREQYVLGYYPTAVRRDGSWHKVRIRVERPGTSVRSRGGYLDF